MKHIFLGAIALTLLAVAVPQNVMANAAPPCEEEICPGVWRPVREEPDFCPADAWGVLVPGARTILEALLIFLFCQPAEDTGSQQIENGPMA